MAGEDGTDRRARGALTRTVSALAVTQLIGWGTTFYLPAILAEPMGAAAGLPSAWVYGGVTLMLLVAAALAPRAGRILERHGAGGALVCGSLALSLGLAILAVAANPAAFVLGWVVIGAATPFALTQSSSVAIVQVAPGAAARRALTILMLFTGMASTASWPVLISLAAWLGLRGSLLVYAGLHLFVCAPIHWLAIDRGRRAPVVLGAASAGDAGPAAAPARPNPVPGAFWLSALAFSCAGIISWGLPLHAVSLLEEAGHPRGVAVAIGAMLGPGQLISRLTELGGGHKLDILTLGTAAAALMPLALLALGFGGSTIAGALVFSVGYGISAGTMSIVRAVAPIRLFGQAGYALVLGRLLVPQNIAFASAPLLFSAIRQTGGAGALLVFTMAVSLLSLAGLLTLRIRAAAAS